MPLGTAEHNFPLASWLHGAVLGEHFSPTLFQSTVLPSPFSRELWAAGVKEKPVITASQVGSSLQLTDSGQQQKHTLPSFPAVLTLRTPIRGDNVFSSFVATPYCPSPAKLVIVLVIVLSK